MPYDSDFSILRCESGDELDRLAFLDSLKIENTTISERNFIIFLLTNVKSKSAAFQASIEILTIDLRPVTIFGFSPWSGISVTSTTCDVASPFSLRATNLYVPLSVADICSISSFTVNSPYSKKSAD